MRLKLLRWANRRSRALKTYCLNRRPPVLTPLVFHAISLLDRGLSGRGLTAPERLARTLWKQNYFAEWNRRESDRMKVRAEAPVASETHDHLHPRGTIFDNSRNPRFNLKVYELLKFKDRIAMMDMGCAGGGLVRSFLEDGHVAIGVEGSDHSKRLRSGEWDTIPYHLFTADVTKPFHVTDWKGEPFKFDLVTAWEVLEHIPREVLPGFIDNVARHLPSGGCFIGSVDLLPDGNPLTGAVYHRTLESPAWWLKQFADRGFVPVEGHPFAPEDMVRGNGLTFKDWWPGDGNGIHLVLRKA